MLAVIADDFTGAAEIGGLALRYGLSVEIATAVPAASAVEVLIVSTDSRSMNKEEAWKITADTLDKLLALKPVFIYKKIDSVLRGHVLAELKIQLAKTGLEKALMVPANPSLGRTIVNGRYYLNGMPIHETSFSSDPEFAIKSSLVTDMVNDEQGEVIVLKPTEPLPVKGFAIGEVNNDEHVKIWASRTGNETLLAGGGDFFMAVMEARGFNQIEQGSATELVLGSPTLLVSGTSFTKSVAAIKALKNNGGPVFYMPVHGLENAGQETEADEISKHLTTDQKAIVAIDNEADMPAYTSALWLRKAMAKLVAAVFKKIAIGELLVEGGSTAAAIIEELQCSRFYPTHELQRGAVRMRMKYFENCHITIKPGSYDWPPQIERLYL
ncbi:MAG: four-carbon acid sugar kinase family protein [Bacteroidota bacterium]